MGPGGPKCSDPFAAFAIEGLALNSIVSCEPKKDIQQLLPTSTLKAFPSLTSPTTGKHLMKPGNPRTQPDSPKLPSAPANSKPNNTFHSPESLNCRGVNSRLEQPQTSRATELNRRALLQIPTNYSFAPHGPGTSSDTSQQSCQHNNPPPNPPSHSIEQLPPS